MGKKKIIEIYKMAILIIVVIIVTAVVTVTYMSNKSVNTKYYTYTGINSKLISKLATVKTMIEKKYLGDEIDEDELIESAVKGYVDGLGDKYTEYFTEEEMEEFKTEVEGNFVGIGIYMAVNEKDDTIVVLYPIEGSSAEEAGIKTGDIIKKVNDIAYTADDFENIASYIKGEEGTKVKLEIERDDETLTFEIERRKVDLYPIKSEVLQNNIGYIEVQAFDEDCAKEFKANYEELLKQNIKGLIIDLRNNGGGMLTEALEMADFALEKDATILITKDKNEAVETEKSENKPIITVPIVIITNGNTASASEVFAAALKENGKATIVGEKTYGKGVIQELITLPDNSGIKITVQEYFTPNENKINKVGITPDIEIALPDDVNSYNLTKENDTQLQAAINVFASK